ncbi:hypothetical protein, partial [Pseudoalteromonas obscura]
MPLSHALKTWIAGQAHNDGIYVFNNGIDLLTNNLSIYILSNKVKYQQAAFLNIRHPEFISGSTLTYKVMPLSHALKTWIAGQAHNDGIYVFNNGIDLLTNNLSIYILS